MLVCTILFEKRKRQRDSGAYWVITFVSHWSDYSQRYINPGPDGGISVVGGVHQKSTYYANLTLFIKDMKKKKIVTLPITFDDGYAIYSQTPQ